MNNPGVCLASAEGLGQVYDCGSCGNVHVQVGPVNLTLDPSAYILLATMIATGASNLESWLLLKHEATEAGDRVALNCAATKPGRTPVN